jgi:integrase
MSIHTTSAGYIVRWREGGRGTRQRSRLFPLTKEGRFAAETFDVDVKRRRQLGTLAELDAGAVTLSEFVEDWWRLHARPNLAASTRTGYEDIWDRHVLSRLGGYQLRRLSPAVVQEFRYELERQGVGAPTVRKAMAVLQSVLRLAVVQGRIQSNPVAAVRKPPQRREREVRPLTPDVIEAIRAAAWKDERSGRPRSMSLRDRTLVSVMAYAGDRPGEALRLTWDCVRERTLLVEGETKTKKSRTVDLLGPPAQDLAEWRMACGRPPDRALVFPRNIAKDGRRIFELDPTSTDYLKQALWRDHDFRNWRRRVYRPAARAVGAPDRPYDLRHSFVSLLIYAGTKLPEVARQAGHSIQTCQSTYMHVFEEFDPRRPVDPEAAIRQARARLREAV